MVLWLLLLAMLAVGSLLWCLHSWVKWKSWKEKWLWRLVLFLMPFNNRTEMYFLCLLLLAVHIRLEMKLFAPMSACLWVYLGFVHICFVFYMKWFFFFLIPSTIDQQLGHICTVRLCIKQDLYMCAEDLNQSCKRESMLIINWSCLSPFLF